MREVMAVLLTACLAPAAVAANDDHEVVFRFTDPAIIESSGLAVLPDGRFVTVNDSGDESRVFTVDPSRGTRSRCAPGSRIRWTSKVWRRPETGACGWPTSATTVSRESR